jgi:hypothetical protein
MPDEECYSPCGGGESVVMNSDCDGFAGESGSDSGSDPDSGMDSGEDSDTGEDSETGTTGMACECESDDECGSDDALVCNECVCVECTADNGAACVSQWLACDVGLACVACSDCGEGVCNQVTGQCLGDGLHVDGDGGQQFESLQEAVAFLDGASGTIILHEVTEMADSYVFDEEFVEVGGGQALSIVAAPGEYPRVNYEEDPIGNPYLFEVNDGSLYMSGFEIVGMRGVQVQKGGQLQLVSMSIETAETTVRVVDEGRAFIANSILRTDEDGESRPAVNIRDTAQLYATFTSIVGVEGDGNFALECKDATKIDIRNSLLGTLGNDEDPFDCEGLSPTTSYVEEPLSPMTEEWFTEDGLHLDTAHTPGNLATAAIWTAGDPTVDIDGDPRPAEDTATFAGADLPDLP